MLSDANAEMIFPVPLFIKLPGQTDGRISSQNAQSIDLLPTIAAIAGIDVSWPVAGHNLLAPSDSPREKIMIDANGKKFVRPPAFAGPEPRASN